MRILKAIVVATATLFLASCASDNSRIDTAVTSCCADGRYETFSVATENMPAFLGPLMVSNFSVAFAGRGMQPVETGGDLTALLRYEQIDLSPDRSRDDFEERIGTGDAMRFIARVAIDIRDAKTGNLVWAGHVQRLHDVGAGDWMHTGLATEAIFDGFNEVLKGYDN